MLGELDLDFPSESLKRKKSFQHVLQVKTFLRCFLAQDYASQIWRNARLWDWFGNPSFLRCCEGTPNLPEKPGFPKKGTVNGLEDESKHLRLCKSHCIKRKPCGVSERDHRFRGNSVNPWGFPSSPKTSHQRLHLMGAEKLPFLRWRCPRAFAACKIPPSWQVGPKCQPSGGYIASPQCTFFGQPSLKPAAPAEAWWDHKMPGPLPNTRPTQIKT